MIDPLRHLKVFDPDRFGKRRVDVIGCGATGSKVALALAKLGVQNLRCFDFDKVEEHNIANQAFGIGDIGKLKVEALKKIIKRDADLTIQAVAEKVDGSQPLGEVVFLLTDTMSSRKQIWEKALRYRPTTKLVIETRMGTDNGRIYAVDPCDPSHVEGWESNLYTDAEADVSVCGARTSVGATADIVAGMAVWQFLRWFSGEHDRENEIIFSLKPSLTMTRSFVPGMGGAAAVAKAAAKGRLAKVKTKGRVGK